MSMKVSKEIKNLKGKSGIFILTHIASGMAYVGRARNLYASHGYYRNVRGRAVGGNSHIEKDIVKYGWHAFKFEWDLCPVDEMVDKAREWSDILDTVQNGYNTKTKFTIPRLTKDLEAVKVTPRTSYIKKQFVSPPEIKNLIGKRGVFILTNKAKKMSYVGTSSNLYKTYHHYRHAERNADRIAYIEKAIREDGWDAFSFEWELCSKDMMKEVAAQWRDKLDTLENGYNRQYSVYVNEKPKHLNHVNDTCVVCNKNQVWSGYVQGSFTISDKCEVCKMDESRIGSAKCRAKDHPPVIYPPKCVPMPAIKTPTKVPAAKVLPKVVDAKTTPKAPTPSVITPPKSDKWSNADKTKLACVVLICITAIACSAIIF